MTITDPTYLSLLAAVIASPNDDLPRLIMADWLEENAGEIGCEKCGGNGGYWDDGGYKYSKGRWDDCPDCSKKGTGTVSNGYAEKAEFIRVQVEIAGQVECESAYCCQQGYDQCRTCKRYEALRQRERELFPIVVKEMQEYLPSGTFVLE